MYPVKQSTSLDIAFFAYDSNGDGVTGKVNGDWTKRISKAGGAFGAMTVTITEMENGWYSLTLSSSHTDTLGILSLSFSATGVKRVNLQYRIHARIQDDLAYPATSGRSIVVDANGLVDANTVKLGPTGSGTAQTPRDIGASVLLSPGTGTGQLDFTSGVVKANLAQILGTALTETAGQIAAAFKKFFDKASPTGTINSIPDAVAGASGGLLIAGSNAATTVNITGNLSGSVGSVTGNVGGNVTGSVGSVTAAVTVGTNNDKTGYSLSAAGIQAIWDALTAALATAGSIGKLLVDNINATISSRLASASYTAPDNATISTINSKLGTPAGASVSADIATVTANQTTINTNVLTRATPAQVNAEVVDALATDTYAEPGSVPAATSSLKDKIGWLFTIARNKRLTTSTADKVRNDADSADIAASTISDDGTTFTRGEYS